MERKCGCKRHLEYNGDDRLVSVNAKKIKKDVIKKLVERNDLSERSKYICRGCATYCESTFLSPVTSESDDICENIKNGKYEQKTLEQIAIALGESQRTQISEEVDAERYDSLNQMLNFDVASYIQEKKNSVLVAFLLAAVGADASSPVRTLFYIAMAIDCVYCVVRPRCITLLCFMLSLVTYVISGSKLIVRILSSFVPCGSYPTLKKFLANLQNSDLLPPPPDRDIITFFDNNQILCKNWKVKYDSKCKVSVITTSIHLIPPDISVLQFNQQLSPSNWLYNNLNIPAAVMKVKDSFRVYNDIFSTYRSKFVDTVLTKVHNEITRNETAYLDMYDYSFVPENAPVTATEVRTAPPIFLNPCSYRAVNDVMQTIHTENCKGGRKWSGIGCDGLPYILGARLIEKDAGLQNILLQPGLGHYEINMVKSCFKLLWDVILQDTAKMLGFKSARALAACERASDHHKAFEILNIVMCACSFELVSDHVRQCVAIAKKPSHMTYYKYLESVKDPNFIFMNEVVFTCIFSLFLFRAGMRRGNSDAMMAGRTKFSPLFFGLHQTFIRKLRSVITWPVCQCHPLWHNIKGTFSVSGVSSKGEGGD